MLIISSYDFQVLSFSGPQESCAPRRKVTDAPLGKGERGEAPAHKQGAVCADRFAKKRTARASGVFIGAVNCRRIKHEVAAAPIRGPETARCRPLVAPNSRMKGVWSYPFLQQVRII